MNGEIPPELGNLSSLTWIELFHNRLSGEVSPKLGILSNLKGLYIKPNQLTGCILESLRYPTREYVDQLGLPFCGS